jgi:DNA gyrase/topoisomerase IV subunit B
MATKVKTIKTDAEKYDKKTQREHILDRSGMYIGCTDLSSDEHWIYSDNKIIKKNITVSDGFLKCLDEMLINARDASVVDEGCDTIKVEYNVDEGYISVYNNCVVGIPIETHPQYKTLVPTMIFGELLTSSNYDDNTSRITGGVFGYGIKLCNIFSTKFIVEIDDAKRGKRYSQTWNNNMISVDDPIITKFKGHSSSVKVIMYPDFKRFNIENLKNDHFELFHRRVIDIAGTSNKLKVYFNDEKINVNNFKSYIELYYKDEIYFDTMDRWSVCAIYKPNNGGEVISFVNSISTYRGGTHCNHVIDNIIKILLNDYIKKKDKDIKISPTLLKENLVFFINSVIVNPSFSSQTKDTLTTKVDKFGSKYEPSAAFLKKLAKCGIVEQVIELAKFKENSSLKKTDGKKQVKIVGIPKLEDANKAGTRESGKCTLILTEGDSAKATAMAGLGVIGRDYYGVFPLKGKLLNVREAGVAQLLANEEIKNLKSIIGLKQDEDYSSPEKFNTLRYGHILLLTDQDSVSGDTPLVLRKNNQIEIKTIDSLCDYWIFDDKEYGNTDYQVWTETGWTKIHQVIRHKVTKRMYRVLTNNGVVDVTEDHSLIDSNNKDITPKDCKIGTKLLHSFPDIKPNNYNITESEAYILGRHWANPSPPYIICFTKCFQPNNEIIEKYASLFDEPSVPTEILNSPLNIRQGFFFGLYDEYNKDPEICCNTFNFTSKIIAQSVYILCHSIGYNIILTYDVGTYLITITKREIKSDDSIQEIIDLGYVDQYVYDLETDNHHFQAGIGKIIVHNTDGTHIKGLFINMLHSLWPSLVKKENFVQSLNTPIVKATKGKKVLTFYNLTNYEKWKKTPESTSYSVKYYKGLGTSTSEEAKEYFIDINTKLINYIWENLPEFSESPTNKKSKVDDDSKYDHEDAIKLGFDKSRADDRKKWLMQYDKNKVLTYEQKEITYYDFIHSDLIHFSNEDLYRSIPSVIDGLKPSQRKILYGAFLRGLDKVEVKVAQLAGFVSDRAAYHHGEMSLNGAIIGMAQNFVGSNNINFLKPLGQYGTRMKAGKDSASPRYIWTKLEDLTIQIYIPVDNHVLIQQKEDNEPIEPEYYAPIIPMVLVNGTEGIGTGFSTKIPPYNPLEIIENLKNIINNKPFRAIDPWWQGFTGIVSKIDDFNYEIYGTWSIDDNTLTITELPVGEWTTNYKEFLEKLLEVPEKDKKKPKKENPFLGYKDNNTDTKIHFELKFEDGYLESVKDIDKLFHLYKKYSITNMHLYGPEGHIKRYENIEEIMRDYYQVRLKLYEKRKQYQLDILKAQLEMISYKVKFILLVVEKKLEINNKKKQDIEEKIESLEFPRIKESYDYLLSMPLYNLTNEKIEELKKQHDDKQTEYDTLFNLEPKVIWLSELNTLEKDYEKWSNKTDKTNTKKVKKTKK